MKTQTKKASPRSPPSSFPKLPTFNKTSKKLLNLSLKKTNRLKTTVTGKETQIEKAKITKSMSTTYQTVKKKSFPHPNSKTKDPANKFHTFHNQAMSKDKFNELNSKAKKNILPTINLPIKSIKVRSKNLFPSKNQFQLQK